MIMELRIENLGIIRAAEIQFEPGMIAFTGETGAGKTMLTSALGLILGDRADYGLVGTDTAHVEARVQLDDPALVQDALAESGGELEDGELLLARSLTKTGRSRAFAGGRSVPAAVLSELAASLTSRHSQSDQIGLRKAARQRAALDQFAGSAIAEPMLRYRRAYQDFTKLSQEVREYQERQQRLKREADVLTRELAEVRSVAPRPNELAELDDELTRLSHAETLRESTQAARTALVGATDDDGPPSAEGLVTTGLSQLQNAARLDSSLAQSANLVLQAQALLAEAGAELNAYVTELDADPQRLNELQHRKAILTALAAKHEGALAGALEWAAAAETQLAGLDPDGQELRAKRVRLVELGQVLAREAESLSAARTVAAQELTEAVTHELRQLSMPDAQLEVSVVQREDPNGLTASDGRKLAFGANGSDVVAFKLRPHPGVAFADLGHGASGGELSRVMLAFEVVLAQSSPPGIFVFDEIDSGVGGQAAVEIGRRLARLARHSQVLVVTHLPQVASFANQQVVVSKDSHGQVTTTSVVTTTGADRVRELSRMLSGLPDSQTGLEHAGELLDLAELERAQLVNADQ
ncbi:MAG: DNA repair protein RecN [Actinomycetia bacterium]|nr:DNA repair protein RecN [Actinomycetes bacterium]